jgi:peptide deformylase
MAILKVARIGHPVVRAAAVPVPPGTLESDALQRLLDDMVETMHEYDGVGLAAPQVHISLRVAVLELQPHDARTREPVPLTVLINPVVTPLGGETVPGWEGCLSVPDLRGIVPRARRVRLEALDRDGKPYALEAEDFLARVIQHECDHLDGKVYLDRMEGMRSLCFLREFERYALSDDDEGGEHAGDG